MSDSMFIEHAPATQSLQVKQCVHAPALQSDWACSIHNCSSWGELFLQLLLSGSGGAGGACHRIREYPGHRAEKSLITSAHFPPETGIDPRSSESLPSSAVSKKLWNPLAECVSSPSNASPHKRWQPTTATTYSINSSDRRWCFGSKGPNPADEPSWCQ